MLGDAAYGNPVGNRLDNNAIYGSGGLGINLRPVGEAGGATVTPNDALDADTGPNWLAELPVITSAQANANGSVTIAFTLDSKANGTYYVSAYANPACNASGHGEGRYYGGNAPVGTNGAGHAPQAPSPYPRRCRPAGARAPSWRCWRTTVSMARPSSRRRHPGGLYRRGASASSARQ